jgi:hypothetical protein
MDYKQIVLYIVGVWGLFGFIGCQDESNSDEEVTVADFSEIDVGEYEPTAFSENNGIYMVEKMTLIHSPLYDADLAEVVYEEETPPADYYFEVFDDKLVSYTANLGGAGYTTVFVADFSIDGTDYYEMILDSDDRSVATRMDLFRTEDSLVLLSTSSTKFSADGDGSNDTFAAALYFLKADVNPWPPAEWPEDVVYEDIGPL